MHHLSMLCLTKSIAKWTVPLLVVILAFLVYSSQRFKNNVCTSFADYYTDRDNNTNCYFNPDINLNASEIIRRRGYPLEEYAIETKDGYILTLFRIPSQTGPPVLLQHALQLNSAAFINRGNKSLGFLLADAGFDVWLGNYRGTLYSKRHKVLSSTSKEFWDFDLYELGVYDVPAEVDFIYKTTKQQIMYVGHSLGTTGGYVYGVTSPIDAKEKLKIIVAVAPGIYGKSWKTLPRYIFTFIWDYLEPVYMTFTNGEVCLRCSSHSQIRKVMCTGYPIQMYFCSIIEMLVAGLNFKQFDPETYPITLMQNADSSSYRVFGCIKQGVVSGNLTRYDYGSQKNMEMYGSPNAPTYNLSLLQVPTYLVTSKNDLLVSIEDVKLLHNALPKEANLYDIFVVDDDAFSHEDFVTGRDVVPLFYNHLIQFLKNLTKDGY